MNIDKLKTRISNTGFKVKVRLRKMSDGTYSIILDYHYYNNGKEFRERKALSIYITGTKKFYTEDKNKIDEALIIRNRYEELVRKKKCNIYEEDKPIYLYEWVKSFMDKQTIRNSMKVWRNAIRHIKIYQKTDMLLKDVTKQFCEGFAQYLKKCEAINQNTAHTYFTRFKIAINQAYEDDIIPRNFANKIIIKKTEGRREYLTIEEIRLLSDMQYVNEKVKRAFIFSCFTGLRLGDILDLKFSDIVAENGHHYIRFDDEKTKGFNKIILHPNAEKIYNHEKEDHDSENVFDLPCESTIRYHIKKMIKKAGIDKHITPHCGRHTFATLSINNDIDIYTLSKYLGHNDVKVTQIYAKLIDKKKDEAINKIPVI
ncbi:tyrosine-type recombinase/integrase [Candidatus Cloacimonadota bacterium]